MNYYSHNIGDFAVETKYMTFEQKGLYIDMIDRYLSTAKPLDTHWVATIKRLASEGAVDAVLMLCFEERDGSFYNERCEKIIADYEAMAEKNRRNALKRSKKTTETEANKPLGNNGNGTSLPSGNPLATQSVATNNHKPRTINQECVIDTRPKTTRPKTTKPKLEKPDGVSDQVWDEWQALKRKLCKSCTQRMVDAIVREADKAGMTVEEAMTYQLEKGWKGFEAEWVQNAQPKNRPTDPQYGIGVCQPLPIEEVHWLTDEERAESRRQMELEGCAPF